MCWLGKEVIPIVLKKPLKVYKLGTRLTKNKFVTAYKKYTYTSILNYLQYRLLSIQCHKASKYWRKRWFKYTDTLVGVDAKVDRRIYEAMKLCYQ